MPAGVSGAGTAHGWGRWLALVVAWATVLGWLGVLSWLKPQYIADEWRHLLVIQGLTRGEWPPAGYLPMLPAYHLLAAGAACVFGDALLVVRALNAILALASVWVVDRIARRLGVNAGGGAVLLFVWNPLLLPYLVMGYTESATMLALLVAVYLHVRGWLLPSVGVLLLACLLRQSSVVWVAFLAGWHILATWDAQPGDGTRWDRVCRVVRTCAGRLWGHLALLVVAAGVLIWHPTFTAGSEVGNRAAVNVAQFYLFGLVVGALWLPLWLGVLCRLWPSRLQPSLAWGWVCALLLAAVGGLEMAYRNPHPWNGDAAFLRNWPLITMMTSQVARLAAAVAIVAVAVLAAMFVYGKAGRRLLLLTWVFSLLYISPHWLVDPRYYIVPTVLLGLLTPLGPVSARWQIAWQAALTAGLAAYIVVCGSPNGGVL